jgi:hypothetical protein
LHPSAETNLAKFYLFDRSQLTQRCCANKSIPHACMHAGLVAWRQGRGRGGNSAAWRRDWRRWRRGGASQGNVVRDYK